MSDHDESLIDKVKHAFGMGTDDDHADTTARSDDRPDGWAGVPEATTDDGAGRPGIGDNPGPPGSARYERGGSRPEIGDTELDTTRDDVKATEFGGAYGRDRPAAPTDAAWDRGEALPDGTERELRRDA